MKRYRAEIIRDFSVSEIITLKATTYGDAKDELDAIINGNRRIFSGRLV